jgi:hypothetical protein
MNYKIVIRLLSITLLILGLISIGQAELEDSAADSVGTEEFEIAPVFKASEILEMEMLNGDHFRVREEVGSDGYWDLYTVDTKFGVFQAHGWLELRTLIQEINAIAYLDELTRTEVFIKGALEAGLEPVELALAIVQHPVQTVSRIPRGIGHMFKRLAERARDLTALMGKIVKSGDKDKDIKHKDIDARLAEACARGDELTPGLCDEPGYSDDAMKIAEKAFDIDEAQRDWHEELDTDPYSTNEVLQNAITEFSWFEGMGKYGLKFTNIRKNPVIRMTTKVYRLAWRSSPLNLRKYLIEELTQMDIGEDQIKFFMGNPYISPTRQTFIVESLKDLEGVEGRDWVLKWAAESQSEDEAMYSASTLALIAWFNTQTPISRFMPGTLLPIVEAKDGRVVALLPIDYLSWTEDVATIINFAIARDDMNQIKDREIWLLNRASDRAKAEMESLGWTVLQDGYKDVLASGEDLELDAEPEPDEEDS